MYVRALLLVLQISFRKLGVGGGGGGTADSDSPTQFYT